MIEPSGVSNDKCISSSCDLSIGYSALSKHLFMADGCGIAGRADASNTRGPRLEPSHKQFLFTVNCIVKTNVKKKVAGNGPFKTPSH